MTPNHKSQYDHARKKSLITSLSFSLVTGVLILACGVSNTPAVPPPAPLTSAVIQSTNTPIIQSPTPVIFALTTQVQPTLPPTDTFTPPLPTATPSCTSAFNCSGSGLPPLVIAPGGPNVLGFSPCSSTQGYPWISVETENQGSNDLQQGQRVYYFACEFSDPGSITAQLYGPGGNQPLSVLTTIPNPDLKMNLAQRVIVFNATCDMPLGSYILDVRDVNGNQSQLSFNLTVPSFQRILVVPQSGSIGTAFQVYYCGYGAQSNQAIPVDFYSGVQRTDGSGAYDFSQIDSWNIPINANGWAVQTLQSFFGDPARAYLINDRDPALDGYDLIWLLP